MYKIQKMKIIAKQQSIEPKSMWPGRAKAGRAVHNRTNEAKKGTDSLLWAEIRMLAHEREK